MRFLIAALSIAGFLVSADAALADKRVAFVVGNSAYKNVAPLPNPALDAKSMAKVLRNVGFDVVEGTNLTRDKMTERLLEFGKKARGRRCRAVLLCRPWHRGERHQLPAAGRCRHQIRDGRQARQRHQCRPHAGADHGRRQGQAGVPRCLPRQSLRRQDRSAGTRSLSVQQGLAEMKSGEGTLIAFATGPGQTALDGEAGTNSPFTRALMANIATPGVEIQQAMTKVRAQVNEETNKGQLPWGHTNLIGTVYLNPAPRRRRAGRGRRIRRPLPPARLPKSSSSSGARSRTPTSRKNSTPISPTIRTAPSSRWRWPASPRCRTAPRPRPAT